MFIVIGEYLPVIFYVIKEQKCYSVLSVHNLENLPKHTNRLFLVVQTCLILEWENF